MSTDTLCADISTATVREILRKLNTLLAAIDLSPCEIDWSPFHQYGDAPLPDYRWLDVTVVRGGSEGWYLHLTAVPSQTTARRRFCWLLPSVESGSCVAHCRSDRALPERLVMKRKSESRVAAAWRLSNGVWYGPHGPKFDPRPAAGGGCCGLPGGTKNQPGRTPRLPTNARPCNTLTRCWQPKGSAHDPV